jgi:hypothetical protein
MFFASFASARVIFVIITQGWIRVKAKLTRIFPLNYPFSVRSFSPTIPHKFVVLCYIVCFIEHAILWPF